jgi:hypothetical protein
VLQEERRTLFLLPKVKVEFRHLSSLQKRFSLCSSHKIKANIVVFCWLPDLQWNNTCFYIPSGLDNFLSYSIPVYTDLILRWVFIGRNKKKRNLIYLKSESNIKREIQIESNIYKTNF